MKLLSRFLHSLTLATLGLLTACGDDPNLVAPPTFERPGDLAFVCFDTSTRALVPLAACDGQITGSQDDRYSLIVLVTQTASGEVGAVDLRVERVVDADFQVPGFTFVRVGETPSGIVVPANDPSVTYVASLRSRRVEWYDTAIFLDAAAAAGAGSGSVALPGGPTDLAIAPDGTRLYVPLPERGVVVPITINPAGTLEPATMADAVVPAPVELPVPTAGTATQYAHVCSASGMIAFGVPTAVSTEITDELVPARPHRVEVVDDQLLVSDAALPMIHRYAIAPGGALTELPPLATGVPVREFAVSPVVPSTTDDASAPARYLYAIDDTDGSVLVMDFEATSPTFGSLLPVSYGQGRSDRLRLSARATDLDLIVREYAPGSPSCAEPTGDEGPAQLRGVFLAVGLQNGLLQVVDVADLDAPCRISVCEAGISDVNANVYVQRNRPRVGSFVLEDPAVVGVPLFLINGLFSVEEANDAVDIVGGLGRLGGCPSGQRFVYGDQICATADPFALRPETWSATYRGTIPGTSVVARFQAPAAPGGTATLSIVGDPIFCARGVLGAEDAAAVPGGEPESGVIGDRVVVTVDPAAELRDDPLCENLFADAPPNEVQELSIPIVRAFADRLEVDASDPAVARLAACYGEALGIDVRLRGSYLVRGSTSGFLHRVIADPAAGNACRVDVTGRPIDLNDLGTFRVGRALPNVPYRNPFVSFTITDTPPPVDAAGTPGSGELEFSLRGLPAPLALEIGRRGPSVLLPTRIERVTYSPIDRRLYVLDSAASSLVQIQTSPIQIVDTFE